MVLGFIPEYCKALDNCKIFVKLDVLFHFRYTLKGSDAANRQISNLKDEVANAPNMQTKVAIISHHLTLASQSFIGVDVDDETLDLMSSTRCSSVAKGEISFEY